MSGLELIRLETMVNHPFSGGNPAETTHLPYDKLVLSIPFGQSDNATATRALDNSEEVVREHYSHTEASELASQMTSAFEEADR